ncbi:MAG: GntR family transcriptional regulator [Oscillospiraceae bacterium]|nr:GntR family transcriptional regulator [Oscillospiraceae bacterium]
MISVNYRDPLPLYEQIKTKLRQLMLAGTYSTETKLPSVRELASQLAINPNTIQRAYRELEAEGYIVSVPGKGSYPVDSDTLKSKTLTQLYSEFDIIVAKLINLGVSSASLSERIDKGGDQL